MLLLSYYRFLYPPQIHGVVYMTHLVDVICNDRRWYWNVGECLFFIRSFRYQYPLQHRTPEKYFSLS